MAEAGGNTKGREPGLKGTGRPISLNSLPVSLPQPSPQEKDWIYEKLNVEGEFIWKLCLCA